MPRSDQGSRSPPRESARLPSSTSANRADPRALPRLPDVGPGDQRREQQRRAGRVFGEQKRGKLVDFLNGPLYPSAEVRAALRDITSGNNGAYKAQAGWDACTGLGVPDGQKPIDALKGS